MLLFISLKKGGKNLSFGENLKTARVAAGMTQAELARRTGITERSIYNYEKNSRAPKIDVVDRFAQALGVQPETLMEGMGCSLSAASPQTKMDRTLRQVKEVFDSDLSVRSKEIFFEEIALAYFRFQAAQGPGKEQ